jgi:hypothetical protein
MMKVVSKFNAPKFQESPFATENATNVFDAVWEQQQTSDLGMMNMNRILSLENRVIWEPIDGQHIVAACKQAQLEHAMGLMSDNEFDTKYATRKARFMVFDNPRFYIEASVRINAKEFERQFYTTMYEDLVKLRAIWSACGKPNADIRTDDANRVKAITMAASALHWTVPLSGKSTTLGSLAKRMLEYTRHAWQENEDWYAATLQVCKDHEEGILWYSEDDEKKWKEYAKKHSLDPNVDVRVDRRRMERLWLRPLSRVPKQQYFRLAQELAAKPIVDGRRQSQKYYFNSATSTTPPKRTLAWVVDRIQRREAVRNAIRWLMVQSQKEPPGSLSEFFTIDVERFGREGARQFQVLGETIDKSMKKAWATPSVRSVSGLQKLEVLIPPFIRQHYVDIVAGGRGYEGYRRDVAHTAQLRWDWQVTIPCTTGGDDANRIPIRCRGGFFEKECVELGEPCLWIFDCRRNAIASDEAVWSEEEYKTVLRQLQRWMINITRWNAVFLLPAGTYFEQGMRDLIAMSPECSWLRGVWMFQPQTVPTYVHDLKHGGQVERGVQVLGDVAIIMHHPHESRVSQNVRRGMNKLPVVFEDKWTDGRMPRAEDRLERSPTELHRLVLAYLPEKWGLVAVGITTSIADIVHNGFVGSQVIVLDGSSTRTRFLHSTLQTMFGNQMQMTTTTTTTTVVSEGVVQEDVNPNSEDIDPDEEDVGLEDVGPEYVVPMVGRRRSTTQVVHSSADESSDKDGSDGNDDDVDTIGSAGEDLHSEDTMERGEHGKRQNSEEDSEDVTYGTNRDSREDSSEEHESSASYNTVDKQRTNFYQT